MTQAVSNRTHSIPDAIHEDVKAIFDFLYGTPERSRVTVLASLMVFAFYVIGTSLFDVMQAQGVCAL